MGQSGPAEDYAGLGYGITKGEDDDAGLDEPPAEVSDFLRTR